MESSNGGDLRFSQIREKSCQVVTFPRLRPHTITTNGRFLGLWSKILSRLATCGMVLRVRNGIWPNTESAGLFSLGAWWRRMKFNDDQGRFYHHLRLHNLSSFSFQRTLCGDMRLIPWLQVLPCPWEVHHSNAWRGARAWADGEVGVGPTTARFISKRGIPKLRDEASAPTFRKALVGIIFILLWWYRATAQA